MKLKAILLTTVLSLGFISSTWAANVPVSKSEIKWVGKKVTGSHDGSVELKEGHLIKNEAGEFTGGSFVINMQSIKVADIADPEKNKKLEGHLKSNDFFGVEAYPTAKLELTSVKKNSDDSYQVIGNLTIKGMTHPVEFKANMNGATLMAKVKVDRTKYNVKYGSGKFFQNLGDRMIYDDFELDVKLTAK